MTMSDAFYQQKQFIFEQPYTAETPALHKIFMNEIGNLRACSYAANKVFHHLRLTKLCILFEMEKKGEILIVDYILYTEDEKSDCIKRFFRILASESEC